MWPRPDTGAEPGGASRQVGSPSRRQAPAGALLAGDTGPRRAAPFQIQLVAVLGTRCNLRCTYCNTGSGPDGRRRQLDPGLFEAWISAFAALGAGDLAVQLHGGEPLVFDPEVEVYAAIARNAARAHPGVRISLGLVTNGVGLDDRRAESLAAARLGVALSIDGPASIHDRARVTAAGRGSHERAVSALETLRRRGAEPLVISVVTRPEEVSEVVRYLVDQRVRTARLSPVRPGGRGSALLPQSPGSFMVEMAHAYLEAAEQIAAHNAQSADRPFHEENLWTVARWLDRRTDASASGAPFVWTMLLDDRGDLWAHPDGYGVEALRMTRAEPPSASLLARLFAIPSRDESRQQIEALHRRLLRPCADCPIADLCLKYSAPGSSGKSPLCVWGSRLTELLGGWAVEHPGRLRELFPRVPGGLS